MTTGGHFGASLPQGVDDAVATIGKVVRDSDCRRDSRCAAVLLNEPVQDVAPHDTPACRSLDRVLDLGGDLLLDPLVRALRVEMRDELREDPPEVALADHDEVPQDLSPHGADEALRMRVLEGRARDEDPDPGPARDLVEESAELVVAVAEEEPGRVLPEIGEDVLELLRRPLARRVISDVPVEDLARPELHEEEDVDLTEEPGRHGEEVARPRHVQVVVEERGPLLPARAPGPLLAEDLLDGLLVDADLELGEQLAHDPLGAPCGLAGPLADQVERLLGESSTARLLPAPPGEPLPEGAEALVGPPDERLGRHDGEELAPTRDELAQEDEEDAVVGVEPRTLELRLVDLELGAKERVLFEEGGLIAREVAEDSRKEARELVHVPIPASRVAPRRAGRNRWRRSWPR